LLTDIGIIFTSYLGLGRTGAIASSFYLHENVLLTLVISLMLDFGQIPVFGFFLESTVKHTGFGRKIDRWLDVKRKLWEQRMNGGGFWAKVGKMQPLTIILVSMIPVRGCGIISACVLCFMLGIGRIYCTVLIMTGSVLGACVTLAVLYEPIRLLHG
jgi:uncharacterized membrane protein